MKVLASAVLLLGMLFGMLLVPEIASTNTYGLNSFVYRTPSFDLQFNHKKHMDEAECEECHKPGDDTRRMALPNHDICVDCHETSEEVPFSKDRECATCHTEDKITAETKFATSLLPLPVARLIFSHKIHVDKQIKCVQCHKDIPNTGLNQTSTLPDMETCEACHSSSKGSPDQCTTCHLQAANGRVLTRDGNRLFQPSGRDRVDRHDATWGKNHSTVAFAKSDECLSCHTEQSCTTCHTTNAVRFVHPANWIVTHTSRSGMQQHRCATCHKTQGFCKDCHQRSKLTRSLPGDLGPRGKYHPEGWMRKSSNGNFHGVRGRMQTTTCTTCHSEQSCIKCHGSRGLNRGGISPHPANFNARRLKIRAGGSCLKCHRANDPNLR